MANIIFTNNCNISCPFCFATENSYKQSKNDESNFDIADTWNIVNFVKSNDFRFCGGEPTQNREIVKAVDLLLKSNKSVFIMTNGIWPKHFKDYISNIHPRYLNKIRFLFNILPHKYYTKKQLEKINGTLSTINPLMATLGMTIFENNFEYKYLLDLAAKYNISKIRWSVSAPNISGTKYTLENDFNSIADRIHLFLLEAEKKDLLPHCDCGYIPPCFYENEKLLDLLLKLKQPPRFDCKGSAVDIDKDGNAWRCYGLYSVLRAKIDNFKNDQSLGKYFTRRVELLDNLHPYEKCKTCAFWQKSCDGGCYAIRIKNLLKFNPNVKLFPVDADDTILNCKPYRVSTIQIINQPDKQILVSNEKIVANLDENKLTYLSTIDGEKTVSELVEKWKANYSSIEKAREEVFLMTRNLFEQDIIKIKYDYEYEYKLD